MGRKDLVVAISSPPYTIGAVDGLLTVLGVKPKLGWGITIFLVGDGVYLARKGQEALEGVYARYAGQQGVPYQEVSFEKAVERLVREGAEVHASSEACFERGIARHELVEGVALSGMDLLAEAAPKAKAFFYF